METASYADIIFFAIVAGIIFYRLFSTLGKKGGHDISSKFEDIIKNEGSKAKVVTLTGEDRFEKRKEEIIPPEPEISDTALSAKIDDLKEKDKSFLITSFLNGAKMAYEMVIEAFASGDRTTLKNLLSKDIYKEFTEELDRLKKSGEKEDITLVSIDRAEIADVIIEKNKAIVTVDFTSQQISVLKDKEGKIIEGDVSNIAKNEDRWVFERNIKSSDPNWTITAT